jgi:flagellar FliJ protein
VKRYRFRLEPVLRVRRTEEESARAQLLAAQAAVATQQELLAARSDAYAAALAPSGTQPCADFLAAQAHRSALGAAVLEQRRRVDEAGQDAEHARASWSAAAARVGALERLDERARAEHLARTLKEDEQITDELVVARHGRTQR